MRWNHASTYKGSQPDFSGYVNFRDANQTSSNVEDICTRAFVGLVREIKIELNSGETYKHGVPSSEIPKKTWKPRMQ